MRVVVLQHIACEPPGAFEDVLREQGATIQRVELDEGDSLPDWHDFDAIVAMGGPMSVNDDETLPWLREEKGFIGAAVRAGVPYWGACLGVQLLAASLGARVYAGPRPEVGLLPITLTEAALADPVFARLSQPGLPLGPACLRRAVPPGGLCADGPRVGQRAGLRSRPRQRVGARLAAAPDRRTGAPRARHARAGPPYVRAMAVTRRQ